MISQAKTLLHWNYTPFPMLHELAVNSVSNATGDCEPAQGWKPPLFHPQLKSLRTQAAIPEAWALATEPKPGMHQRPIAAAGPIGIFTCSHRM